jgi:hypothetical protein
MSVLPPQIDQNNSQPSMEEEIDDSSGLMEREGIEILSTSKIPWLQEVFLTTTKILVLFITVVVITLSIGAKVEWGIIILRAGVTILVLGLFGYLFNWILGKFLVDAKVLEFAEKIEAEEEAAAERLTKEQEEMEALDLLQQQENEDNQLEIET